MASTTVICERPDAYDEDLPAMVQRLQYLHDTGVFLVQWFDGTHSIVLRQEIFGDAYVQFLPYESLITYAANGLEIFLPFAQDAATLNARRALAGDAGDLRPSLPRP